MFFKLACKNVKKSFKDYAVYFLTLTFAVCLFYAFNSLNSQKAMLDINASTKKAYEMLTMVVEYFSYFVAVVLGFLIVYANNFLVKRRKKELGLYMLLGLGRGKISGLLLFETLLVGVFALAAGLVTGVFLSQGMSVVTASLFEVNMQKFQFIFSQDAMVKTLVCFGIIFLIVMVFNTISVGRVKLIDMLTASRRNEKPRFRHTAIVCIAFVLAVIALAMAYHTALDQGLMSENLQYAILLGCVGTVLLFFSLSGFLLRVLRRNKRLYYKGLNMFVLRQVNSRINTAFVSLSVICLMLFVTICTFSGGTGIASGMSENAKKLTPYDYSIQLMLPAEAPIGEVDDLFQEAGLDESLVKDSASFRQYETDVQVRDVLLDGAPLTAMTKEISNKKQAPTFVAVPVSDFNKTMRLIGAKEVTLAENQYLMLGSENTAPTFNYFLQKGGELTVNKKALRPLQNTVEDAVLCDMPMASNDGYLVLPDALIQELPDEAPRTTPYTGGPARGIDFMTFNVQFQDELDEKTATEKMDAIADKVDAKINSIVNQDNPNVKSSFVQTNSRESIYASMVGLKATGTYVAIYLGFVFLIAGAAMLALQQLSEAADNAERYGLLRKLGAEPGMVNGALFKQIAIYFLLPLLIAVFHSVFGLKAIADFLLVMGEANMFTNILQTACFVLVIYGLYFIATYLGCRSTIREQKR